MSCTSIRKNTLAPLQYAFFLDGNFVARQWFFHKYFQMKTWPGHPGLRVAGPRRKFQRNNLHDLITSAAGQHCWVSDATGTKIWTSHDTVQTFSHGNGALQKDVLLDPAAAVQKHALPPWSRLFCQSSSLSKSEAIYLGFNFFAKMLNPELNDTRRIICRAKERAITMVATNAAPCGHCRQFLDELRGAPHVCCVMSPGIPAQQKNASLPYIAAFQLAELLPESFGPLDLHLHDDSELFRSQGITTSRCLLKLWTHTAKKSLKQLAVQISPAHVRQTPKRALGEANLAYTSYGNSPAGLAIYATNGKLVQAGR